MAAKKWCNKITHRQQAASGKREVTQCQVLHHQIKSFIVLAVLRQGVEGVGGANLNGIAPAGTQIRSQKCRSGGKPLGTLRSI